MNGYGEVDQLAYDIGDGRSTINQQFKICTYVYSLCYSLSLRAPFPLLTCLLYPFSLIQIVHDES